MDALQLKSLIREALTEAKKAKEEKKDNKKEAPKKEAKKDDKKSKPKAEAKPKSTGKLVDLKKEKEALKSMQEALGKYICTPTIIYQRNG